jgi:hypothetical protein
MKGFEAKEVQTEQNSIFVRVGGSGPTILLLHGFPQTHLMWRNVAPILSREFTVVCADLRGYGRSGCPPSTVDHSPYSKRAMAQEMVLVMEQLGFSTDRKLLFARAAVLDAARVKLFAQRPGGVEPTLPAVVRENHPACLGRLDTRDAGVALELKTQNGVCRLRAVGLLNDLFSDNQGSGVHAQKFDRNRLQLPRER